MAIDTEERTTKTTPAKTGKGAAPEPAAANNKKVIKIVLIVVGAVIVLAIIGSIASAFLIKKGTESFINTVTDGKAQVDSDKGEVTIKGEDGSQMTTRTTDAEIPEGYPESDVPVYKNADIKTATDMNIDDSSSYTMSLTTRDSAAQVMKFYKAELSGGGWKRTYSTNSSGTSMASYSNKSKNMTAIIGSTNDKDGGDTTISLTVRTSEEQ
ncbi:MAG: hypothetical protein L0H36_02060 [bacterium]|nr:hypothetical protein [bacterium]MDN5835399.1 hypothetical protein [bacterium]